MQIDTNQVADGIKIISIPTAQYKTNLVSIYIKRQLSRDEVTKNSLIPYVLRSGSQNFQSESIMLKRLQELYGSSISVSVNKIGERQIIGFKLSYTDEQYLDEKISQDTINVLMDMIFNPLVIKNAFNENFVRLEKETLREAILSKINNKGAYAMEQMINVMCKDEPFSIPEDGFVEDFDKITPANLYEHYKKIIETSEIDVTITGNIDYEVVKKSLLSAVEGKRGKIQKIERENIYNTPESIKETKESMQVNQGKLAIGFRTNIAVEDELSVPLTLYAMVLGGGASSKLFLNVREKASLCYSIGAGLDKMKSLMFIHAGIEIADFEKAKELIFKELEDMKNGRISDVEFSNAKKSIINQIKSVKDSVWGISDYIYSLSIQGQNDTPESIIEKIEAVKIEQLKSVAKKIQPDTIYFLTNDEVPDAE